MYSNISNMNSYPMSSSSSFGYSPNMYSSSNNFSNSSSDRIIGAGFAAPFLLGGITGGLLAPAFYPRPYYGPYYPRPYGPYPYYGPYYR